MVALYDNAAGFPLKPVRTRKVAVHSGDNQVQFSNLPGGDYAVVVYHDANSNGQIERNDVGIPTEDYGFSNNAIGQKGPPCFEAMKIRVGDADAQPPTQTRISLR